MLASLMIFNEVSWNLHRQSTLISFIHDFDWQKLISINICKKWLVIDQTNTHILICNVKTWEMDLYVKYLWMYCFLQTSTCLSYIWNWVCLTILIIWNNETYFTYFTSNHTMQLWKRMYCFLLFIANSALTHPSCSNDEPLSILVIHRPKLNA